MNLRAGILLDDLESAVRRVGSAWDDLRGARIFITGGSGFLGQWLLALLLEGNRIGQLGLRVSVLTRSPERFMARRPDLAGDPAVELVAGDVRFFNYPKGHYTHLIHAATDTSVEADRDPLKLIDSIVGGTSRVLAFAHSAGIQKVLFTSSGAVYGAQPESVERIQENYSGACSTTDRRSCYGQAKRLAEQLVTVYHAEFGLQTRIARCFAFVGPGMAMDAHFAIGNFIRDAVAGGPIVVTGDGQPIRSYLYAADAAVWLLRILVEGKAGAAYNVGSGEGFSLAQVAARVANVVGGQVQIRGRPADGFRSRYLPDVELARATLGLEVWTDLNEAIARTAQWHAERCRKESGPCPEGATEAAHPQEGHAERRRRETFVIDIDGVLATLTPANDYRLAGPLAQTIAAVNALYDRGHRIILFTARGSATGIDWTQTTREQLQHWGVRHHELRFGKPAGDYYVDDRMISIGQLQLLAKDRP